MFTITEPTNTPAALYPLNSIEVAVFIPSPIINKDVKLKSLELCNVKSCESGAIIE